MAWRTITESDLLSALSSAEVEAFRRSADFETDPVDRQIADAAEYVRGLIRSGGVATLSTTEGALPPALIPATLDYLRYRFLTRMNIVVNESRTQAYKDALALFEKVRTGDYVPEADGVDDGSDAKAVTPEAAEATPTRLLD